MATVTASDLIGLAFRRLGITAEGEQPSADEATDGLSALNIMLHGFSADGINYAHADLALSDTLNFPDREIGFVRDLLAEALAADYGVTPTQALAIAIANARQTMRARYTYLLPAAVDISLRRRRDYESETGSG